jgi:hypothetical protein
MSVIPRHLHHLFWDVDVLAFEPLRYPGYTIMRVLEYGDRDAIAWLHQTFAKEEIKAVLCAEKRLSRKTATFWSLVYHVPPGQIAALR